MRKITHVAAGILLRADGSFLLGSRPAGKPYAGYWEFPGGKLENGESELDALKRELVEEMGISVTAATPWIVQTFDYPHASVRLSFFRISGWEGKITAHEGQEFAWQVPGQLNVSPILPANGPILRGLALPDEMAISNMAELGETAFLAALEKNKPRWLILREPQLNADQYRQLAEKVLAICKGQQTRLMLHDASELAIAIGADGVHLPARSLLKLEKRPALDWVGASTHNAAELSAASALSLDYALLGHISPTPSHPDTAPLGWEGFDALIQQGWPLPVYALGGMKPQDLALAQQHGAHGVALMRAAWI
ncbi:Nudix family hydrolase [Iodobacter fluviatilis]|uniref:8-oxo-dGTP diphosphatase n=1 Tax=Iodobacter fluviatilis TaxID=537 RepID=A0A377Q923_9NEIS|nr:Nudix family hydrolase [Iodobacter fluviatilis]TCU87029.1 8-oxo-dGTP diphosphatase [Iodobacter fluviatilis]STQ90361.1 CTP pyrophosphohydrolase [Iodobacter fluviatilis]